jgi:hypothetical protein
MSLQYIRDTYQVPAHKGSRVRYSPGHQKPVEGTIVGALHGHLRLLLDGNQTPGLYHPTWKIEYL